MTFKKRKSNSFFKNSDTGTYWYVLKCPENAFLLLALWKEDWIRNFLLVKEESESESGSEKNSYGSTTLLSTVQMNSVLR
jgi:hypothetical protein